MKHLVERESFWVKWKNEGCPKFMREKEADVSEPAPKKRRSGRFYNFSKQVLVFFKS